MKNFDKELDLLKRKGLNAEVLDNRVIVTIDKEGYITGVKMASDSEFLGKKLEDLK